MLHLYERIQYVKVDCGGKLVTYRVILVYPILFGHVKAYPLLHMANYNEQGKTPTSECHIISRWLARRRAKRVAIGIEFHQIMRLAI